ncbi:hypothetical protein D3C87_520510 [compost metagenome]
MFHNFNWNQISGNCRLGEKSCGLRESADGFAVFLRIVKWKYLSHNWTALGNELLDSANWQKWKWLAIHL